MDAPTRIKGWLNEAAKRELSAQVKKADTITPAWLARHNHEVETAANNVAKQDGLAPLIDHVQMTLDGETIRIAAFYRSEPDNADSPLEATEITFPVAQVVEQDKKEE